MKTVLSGLVAVAVALSAVAAEDAKEGVQLTPEQTEATVTVGQTVYFGVPVTPRSGAITGLKVKINGKVVKVGKGDTKETERVGASYLNYVYKAQKPGAYKVEVAPVYKSRTGDPVKYTLKVEKE